MKQILYLIIGLALVSSAYAVPINYINVNQTECEQEIGVFEELGLFEGLSSITFYERHIQIGAWNNHLYSSSSYYHWFARKITIRSGCDVGTLIHELAHHDQKMNGVTFQRSLKHDDDFKERYERLLGLIR